MKIPWLGPKCSLCGKRRDLVLVIKGTGQWCEECAHMIAGKILGLGGKHEEAQGIAQATPRPKESA